MSNNKVAIARRAWEAGYSYIARKINEDVLSKRAENLSLPCDYEQTDATFSEMCIEFHNALNAIRDLVPRMRTDTDARLTPWCIGYLNGRYDEPRHDTPHLVGTSLDDDDTIKKTIEIWLSKSRSHWNEADWESCIVKGIVEHAEKWREWFAELDGPFAIMLAYARLPKDLSEADRVKRIQHLIDDSPWNSFPSVRAAASKQDITLKPLSEKVS